MRPLNFREKEILGPIFGTLMSRPNWTVQVYFAKLLGRIYETVKFLEMSRDVDTSISQAG
jgi:hypothetical protein